MTDARDSILNGLARNIRGGPASDDDTRAVDDRLKAPKPGPVPARAQIAPAAQAALFVDKVKQSAASIERLPGVDAIPGAISSFLSQRNLPQQIRASDDPLFDDVPWSAKPTLTVDRGAPLPNDRTTVTKGLAGIAETGTVVMAHDGNNPHMANFLPEVSIVVVAASEIAGSMEDIWRRLRAEGRPLPRALTMITGPSRTGDIAQRIELGAHGPRQVHILLLDAQAATQG